MGLGMSNFLDALLGSGTAQQIATSGLPVVVNEAEPPEPGQALIAIDGQHARWSEIVATGVDVVAGAGLIKTANLLAVGAPPDGSIVINADDIRVGVLGPARVLTALIGQRVGQLLDPSAPQDAATRAWVEGYVAGYVGEAGGGGGDVTPEAVLAALAAASASVAFNAQRLTNIATPVGGSDAATRAWVEAVVAAALASGGGGSTVTYLGGNGLVAVADGGGNVTFNVGANGDGSIVVAADDIRLGTIPSTQADAVVTPERVVTALGSAAGDVSVNSRRLTSVGAPTQPTDAATRAYADAAAAAAQSAATVTAGNGITKTGASIAVAPADASISVAAGGVSIGVIPAAKMTGLPSTAVGATDATSKAYTDAQRDAAVATAAAALAALALTDAQHGARAGGTLHANVVAAGAAGFMTGADKTKLDGVATGATVAPALANATPSDVGSAAASGIGTTTSRVDHIHGHGNQAGGTLHANVVAAGAAGFMSGADKTKLDGVATGATVAPALASTTPAAVGTAAIGVGTTTSRADHVHAHGNQLGGTLHADVIAAGASGFMSGTDKTKLDGIATGAQVTNFANVAAALAAASASVVFNAQRLTGVADPTAAQDGSTKAYTDASKVIYVRAVYVSPFVLSGLTVGDYTLANGELALATAQTNPADNGLYVASAGAWSRATAANSVAKLQALPPIVDVTGNIWSVADRASIATLGTSFVNFGKLSTILGTITPETVRATASIGNAVNGAAAADHAHAHGAQAIGDGTNHATATTSFAGFMSAADRTKMNTLVPGQAATLGQVTVDAVHDAPVTLTLSSGAATHNTLASNRAQVSLTANATLTLSNLANGRRGIIAVRQDATGSRTLAFTTTSWTQLRDASYGDLAPSAAASSVTLYTYACEVLGGTQYIIFGKLMAA